MKVNTKWILLLFSNFIIMTMSQISSPGAISSFSPGGQYILLTINDFATPDINRVLDILRAKKAKATFFISGSTITKENREILRTMTLDGHDVANHAWLRSAVVKLPREKMKTQIEDTSEVITEATGIAPRYFRPPFGQTNAQVNEFVRLTLNMTVILWSLDSKDWEHSSPQMVKSNILSKAQPGDIILCHADSPSFVAALGDIIDGLYIQGYELLTVSQILLFPDDKPH